jgi:hypothetical protein
LGTRFTSTYVETADADTNKRVAAALGEAIPDIDARCDGGAPR